MGGGELVEIPTSPPLFGRGGLLECPRNLVFWHLCSISHEGGSTGMLPGMLTTVGFLQLFPLGAGGGAYWNALGTSFSGMSPVFPTHPDGEGERD